MSKKEKRPMRNKRIHVMIDRRLTSDEKKALNNSDTLDDTPPIHLPAPNGHYSYAPTAQQHASPEQCPGCSSPSTRPEGANCYSPWQRPDIRARPPAPKGPTVTAQDNALDVRARPPAPKGQTVTAQGNALGQPPPYSQALKGRSISGLSAYEQ